MCPSFDADLPNHAELVVEQKSEGKNRLWRTLLILGYVIFAFAFFIAAFVTGMIPLVAILPVLLYILFLCTWRYVQLDYAILVGEGSIIIEEIQRSRWRKRRLQVTLKNAGGLAPCAENESQTDKAKSVWIYDYRGSKKTPDAHKLYFTDGKGRPSVLYFATTPALLRSVRRYMNA